MNPLCLLTTTGVKRLLFKLMRTKDTDLEVLRDRLKNLPMKPHPRGDTMGALGHHIAKFRLVSREFASNWPSGNSTMFVHKAPHVFGIAKTIRMWVSLRAEFTGKKQLYAFMMGHLEEMDIATVKAVLKRYNCGETICRISTTCDLETNQRRKIVVPTTFVTRFVGVRTKRQRVDSSSDDSASSPVPASRSRRRLNASDAASATSNVNVMVPPPVTTPAAATVTPPVTTAAAATVTAPVPAPATATVTPPVTTVRDESYASDGSEGLQLLANSAARTPSPPAGGAAAAGSGGGGSRDPPAVRGSCS